MSHTQIALSIWGALAVCVVLCLIAALGQLFGHRNVLGALLGVVVMWGGGIGLILYTLWAIFGGH
jgi:hypothetical protein